MKEENEIDDAAAGGGGGAAMEGMGMGILGMGMFPGHDREREMSAMVTALTNVVAGNVSNHDHMMIENNNQDGGVVEPSCSWGAGHKRGRHGQVSESVSTISEAFGQLLHGGSSSSSSSYSSSLPAGIYLSFFLLPTKSKKSVFRVSGLQIITLRYYLRFIIHVSD